MPVKKRGTPDLLQRQAGSAFHGETEKYADGRKRKWIKQRMGSPDSAK